jgi:hypothetical protein
MKFEIYSFNNNNNNNSHNISRIKLITPTKESSNNRMLSPNTSTKVKRNLFGHLNHDMLKTDLNEMWKETIEKQKIKWNFDFETLCPTNSINKINNNYEWTIVDDSRLPDFYKKTYKTTKRNVGSGSLNSSLHTSTSSSSDSTDEEEEDESSFNDKKPIFQMRLRTTPKPLTINNNNNKKKSTKTQKENNLVITNSENRKDTLRSSTKAKSKIPSTTTTTKASEYKQQTLLGIFILIKLNSSLYHLSLFNQ